MNYTKSKELFIQTQDYIRKENYLEALNLLVKISSAFLFFRDPPFHQEEINHLARICRDKLVKPSETRDKAQLAFGVILRNEGFVEESLRIFDRVLENNFQKEAILEKAYALELLGDVDKAMELLEKGLKEYPFDKMILNNIATLHELQEDWDLALNYYNLSLEVDQDGGISYYNKGRVLYILEDYIQAAKHFERALELYDDNDFRIVDVYIFLGDCHHKLRQYHDAEKIYQKVTELFPNRGEGYYSLSEFYFSVGRKAEALKHINTAITLSHPNTDYYYNKAYYQNEMNQGDKAIFTVNEGIKHFPDDVKLLDLKTDILMSQGKYRSAVKMMTQRLNFEQSEHIYFQLAECHFYLSEHPESMFWLNQYLKNESGDSEAYILRAKINAATGYFRLALNDLQQTLEIENGRLFLQESDWYHFEKLVGFEEYQDFLKEVRS